MRRIAIATLTSLAFTLPAIAQQVETKQYEDGGVYVGAFKNGKQHGQGSYTLPNG